VLDFKNKVAAVTGAGLGIGRATAVAFASYGAKVAVIDLNLNDADAVVKEITSAGGEAIALKADVSSEIEVKGIMRSIEDKWAQLDILVNNAGIYLQKTAENTSLEEWNKVLDVNLTGAFLCSREAVCLMKKAQGGVIVNVASEAGLVGIKGQAVYNVSKFALIGLTKSMAVDEAPLIRVNCMCPGTTFTPLVQSALDRSSDPDSMLKAWGSCRPMNRLGKPEEIAWGILFLASGQLGYSTGAVLAVDGGYTSQ